MNSRIRNVRFPSTGWSVLFRPSGGLPPQGETLDFVWIDEHINNAEFFYESVRGLTGMGSSYQSLGVWSATGQKQNYLLWDLMQVAESQAAAGKPPTVSTYFMVLDDNPYIDPGERRILFDFLPPDEQRVRIYGQHALAGWRIYPRFEPMGIHGCEPFEIPSDWTRYLALDPGTTHCATVFGAVDPEQRHLWITGELLLNNANAGDWAMKLAECRDAKHFYSWIIDSRAGRQKGMGGYQTFAAQYFKAARDRGITPLTVGSLNGFIPGCDNPDARREALAGKLWVRDYGALLGTAELRVFHGACPMLTNQIQRAQFDAKNPAKRLPRDLDLLDALEYLAAANPCFVPHSFRQDLDPVYRNFLNLRASDSSYGNSLCTAMEIN